MLNNIRIYAVDFDGTLYLGNTWPDVIPDKWNNELISKIEKLQEASPYDQWVLWTCRDGYDLDIAINAIKSLNIKFDAINDNAPVAILRYGCNPRKIIADVYIDDASVKPEEFLA